ncbi:hypothetical protein HFP72_00670 [Nocardiopsis sp. ARC36]
MRADRAPAGGRGGHRGSGVRRDVPAVRARGGGRRTRPDLTPQRAAPPPGDAHRAAWAAEGLSVEEVRELTGGPLWERIEADTNRRDEPVYAVLSEAERWEFASGLGSLPDGLRG